jgi:hypothetical protein
MTFYFEKEFAEMKPIKWLLAILEALIAQESDT